MILAFIPFMAWMSRAGGGGFPKLPWGLDAWILCAPYLLFWYQIGWWVIPAYAGAVLGLRLGHGRFFYYDRPFKQGSQPEKVEIFIPKIFSLAARKFLGMFLTGLAVTLILVFALALSGFYLAALILALSGALKSAAYLLPKTEWAEIARGAFLGLGVVVGLMVI